MGRHRETLRTCVVVSAGIVLVVLAFWRMWQLSAVMPARAEVSPVLADGSQEGQAGAGVSSDDLFSETSQGLAPYLGKEMAAVIGEGVTRRIVSGDLPHEAEEVLHAYVREGACTLVQAGFLDFVGDVWACTVQGEGWVEVTVVRTRPEGGSEVTTIHMDAHEWARQLSDGAEGEE